MLKFQGSGRGGQNSAGLKSVHVLPFCQRLGPWIAAAESVALELAKGSRVSRGECCWVETKHPLTWLLRPGLAWAHERLLAPKWH